MRTLFFILAAAVNLTLLHSPLASADTSAARDTTHMQNRFRQEYLHVDGTRLVTASGREVKLRGVNVGGWLVTETWMCGFIDSKDTAAVSGSDGMAGRSTLESLEARFGEKDAAKLMSAWQDHWFTTRDLDKIRDWGFNLIRVPISYRTLEHADGSWILDGDGRIDFSRMDWVVNNAARRGIYVVFVLHVWPHQRYHYSELGQAAGASMRASMAQLWTTIATHYRGNGAIAGFDLINEFPGAWGVQQVLSQAVQAGDPNRVQVVEGFTFAEYLALRRAGTFPNSVFAEHVYRAQPITTDAIIEHLRQFANSPSPIYISEFLAADLPAAAHALSAAGVSWSPWTYKTVDMGDWGLFNYGSEMKTDIQQDSYDAILDRWSRDLTAWQRQSRNPYLNEQRVPARADVEGG